MPVFQVGLLIAVSSYETISADDLICTCDITWHLMGIFVVGIYMEIACKLELQFVVSLLIYAAIWGAICRLY